MNTIEFLKNDYGVILIAITVSGALFAILREYLSFIKWRTMIEMKMDDLEPIRKNATAIAELPEKVENLRLDVEEIRSDIKGIHSDIEGIHSDIEGIHSDIEGIRSDIKGIHSDIGVMNSNITSMCTKMDILFQRIEKLPSNVFQSDSPLSLSDYGQGLSDKINAHAIAAKYKERLISMAREQNMRPYQIQQCCFEYASKEILKDLEKNDKERYYLLTDAAFNEGVEIEKLLQITGLVLRDQVLETFNGSNTNAKTESSDDPKNNPTAANQ